MTDLVPSKGTCPVCDTPDGDHLDWCTPQAREQRPSKDVLPFTWDWDADARTWRLSMVEMGDGLLAGYDHLAGYYERRLIEEIQRLRTALTGISTCSTCEACRGAATLALGGAKSKPAHEREPPHCSTCSCGMSAPEPPAALGWRDAVAISTGEKTVIATNRSAQHPSPALAHCAHTLAALCKQHDLYFSDATYRGCVDTVLMLTEGHAQPPGDGQ